ncbi:hypothetical protein BdWA1_000409 [Babesia duncani]|uniref:Uncharacterized protein n=1 Tax=Babesia duncani TaxID=323732 RepID=A0AAD9UPZ4_9APIC|nr:hypothetical protein BdWA1_003993 [Babesia duncani]KAK2194608.1 hypothetical protein BdWA1_003922 [Babesia duncani]KAK2197409.1 hypothetical protein BdWA1_000409 [Babesia duncani]
MSTASINLLNRTKYAQNKRKYFAAGNTLLSLLQRPLFVVDTFQQCKQQRKLEAIRKAFVNKRKSKRGLLDKLCLPHAYTHAFGDPKFMSINELCATCEAAANLNLRDADFWTQICDKLRRVRDVMGIEQLVACLQNISHVNHYDPDLLRMLSKELVDDIDRLEIFKVAQVLQCYYNNNVYSIDLVNAAGQKCTKELSRNLESLTRESPKNTFLFKLLDNLQADLKSDTATRGEIPDSTLSTLGTLCKCLCYFGYRNSSLYLTIASIFIHSWRRMDIYKRCLLFYTLDPNLLEEIDGNNSKITNDIILEMLKVALQFKNELVIGAWNACNQEYNIPAIIVGCNDEKAITNIYKALDISSGTRVFSRFICSICDKMNRLGKNGFLDYKLDFNVIMEKFADHVIACTQLSLDNIKSPCDLNVKHLLVESLLDAIVALNCTWRMSSTNQASTNYIHRATFTDSDDNIHAQIYRQDFKIEIDAYTGKILAGFIKGICKLGCKGQDSQRLVYALETLAIASMKKNLISIGNCIEVNQMQLSLDEIQSAYDIITLEIVRRFVSLSQQDIYRTILATKYAQTKANDILLYHLNTFPKFSRMKKTRYKIACTNPYKALWTPLAIKPKHKY